MKLPSAATIATRKLTEYLLSKRQEDDKSQFLGLAGYTLRNSERLLEDLKLLARTEATFVESTEYGDKYEIRGKLVGPNGQELAVTTIWMTEIATGETKFITL